MAAPTPAPYPPLPALTRHFENQTVLVTGASSGIGRELARQFAAHGARLILVARRVERLQQLGAELKSNHGAESWIIPCDLADAEATQALLDHLRAAGDQIDILVNNAGFGQLGRFDETDPERLYDMVAVNVAAVTRLTRSLLPGMIARRRGGVLNVASTAAFQPGPNMAVYYASKAYVLLLSEAIYEECSGTGVKVSCLCPGPVDTEFGEDSGMEKSLLFKLGPWPADKVARAGIRGLRRGKPVVIPGFFNKLSAFSVRFMPRWAVRKAAKRFQSLGPRGKPRPGDP